MRIVTFLIWVGLAPVGLAGWDAGVQGRVETAVGGFMDKHRVPGMSVAVVDGGELVWEAGFGVADLENDVPATAKTVYRLASISKAVTAVAAMKLAEEGKLDLDRPVGESVDAWPQEHAALTVRQLLGHTAGVRHYRPLEAFRTTHSASLESALDIFKDDALLSQPGTKYRYSTYGYTLAGRAMEVAAGEAFMDLLARTVTTPSGATTLVEDSVAAIIPHRAQGYVWSGSAYYNSALSNSSYKIPGGGLAGTAGDLGRFAAALMRGELVSEGSMEAMWTAQTLADGSKTTYGLGWNVAEYDGRREVSHGGSQQRVRTFLALVPEEKVAVAVMCNLERINPKPFGWTLVRLVLGDAE